MANKRKRNHPLTQPNSLPTSKRKRASNQTFDEVDSNEQEGTGGKEKFEMDEDGSFFLPPKPTTGNSTESCIKFVPVLPSEIQTGLGLEDDADNVERRVTWSASKKGQATLAAPVTPKPKCTPAKLTKAKSQPKPQSKATPKSKPTLSKCASKAVKSSVVIAREEESLTPTRPKKLTLKLSMSSIPVVQPEVEEGEDSDDEYHDEYEEELEENETEEIKVEEIEIAFAVERDGAREIICLPLTIGYDALRFRVSCLLPSLAQADMKLVYKLPGMRKQDAPIHLATIDHFHGLITRVRSDIQQILADMKTMSGNGKRAMDQRAKAANKIKTYTITISNHVPPKPNTKGKQGENSTSKAGGKDLDMNSHEHYCEYIRNRPKCKICDKNCAIIPLPKQGPVHITLTEECIDLWAKLSVLKQANPYTPNPPEQVLELLRTVTLACSKRNDSSGPSQNVANSGMQQASFPTSPSHDLVQTSLPPLISTAVALNTSTPTPQNHPNTSFATTSVPFGLGASQMTINPAVFAGIGQGAGLGASVLPSFPTQLAQFPAGMAQSPMIVYNMPPGVGLGMNPQQVMAGYPGVSLGAVGGFPVFPFGGMFPGPSNNTE
ncbi:hypothetical protein FRC07_015079 [Ceratobasidium sp. 392]|nr:hypothetical protein FRC07_015079 [Ceratobasidium sp. 392]